MEAKTLKTKKQIKKGKLKKTMKNIICQPDSNFWPQISDDENKSLLEELNRLKVEIPDYKKPLWSELSRIPKELRPKPPPTPKVMGLIFGKTACEKAIESNECIAVLIEATVNPKSIVQPLIEICCDKSISVLCLKDLRRTTKVNFGIATSVLGVQQNCLDELEKIILHIFKAYRMLERVEEVPTVNIDEEMSIATNGKVNTTNETILCPYLYRANKRIRIFSPSLETAVTENKFVGQNFIKLPSSQKDTTRSKQYMKMIVKKISSNPNRKNNVKVNPNN